METGALEDLVSGLCFFSGFGFRVSSFGFRISGFGFRALGSGFGFGVWGFGPLCQGSKAWRFGFRDSGFGIRVRGSGPRDQRDSKAATSPLHRMRIPDFVYLVSGIGLRVSGFVPRGPRGSKKAVQKQLRSKGLRGSRVPGIGFRASYHVVQGVQRQVHRRYIASGFRVSGFAFQISGIGFRASGCGLLTT